MNLRCRLGYHKWTFDKKALAFKCERCGKTKVTPEFILLQFTRSLFEVQMKANEILGLLAIGKIEEAKTKLEEWKRTGKP
jgi:hypothetical protein